MKSSELFDILGGIDDKFFEEAKQPDAQQGEIVIAETSAFGRFMSIFAPIAACVAVVAAVVIGANFIGGNAGIVGPNESDSTSSDVTLSSDNGTVSTTESTSSGDESSVPENNGKTRIEDYPPIDLDSVPDIKGSGLETQMSAGDRLLKKATLATVECGDYTVYLLGQDMHIDKSSDPNLLYSYSVKLAVVKDGEVVSEDGVHTFSVSMGQGGYKLAADDLDNYLEHYRLNGADLILFKYHEPHERENCTDYECTFFSVADDGELNFLMGDNSGAGGSSMGIVAYLNDGYTVDAENNTLIDGDVIYRFNCENFGLNPYDAIHYTSEINLDLSEYPALDMSQVPDAAEITDWDQCLPKAKLAEKQVGYYTLVLIGEHIRSPKQVNPDTILAENVRTVVIHNGKTVLTKDEPRSINTDVLKLDEEFMTTYQLNYGVVFVLPDSSTGEKRFGTISGDHMTVCTGDRSETDGAEPPAEYDPYDPEVIVLPEENALIYHKALKYVFDFPGSYTTSYTSTEPFILAEYGAYDKSSTDYQAKVILEEKEAGGYKFYLLGKNVKNSLDIPDDMLGGTFSVCYATNLIAAVEKDGKLLDHLEVYNPNTGLDAEMIGQFLRPFEMKDGIGFVLYCSLNSSGNNPYAMIYKVENDTITQMKYEFDYAPAPATGSPQHLNPDYTVDPENNALSYKDYDGEEVTLTLDFANNMFS
ncbi:MAG: hypothetical protein NC401_19275 [Ruminococcus sp.]|nr:hypothetical protein [Ruminococcus sp.]